MSTQQQPDQDRTYSTWQVLISILATFLVIGLVFIIVLVVTTPAGQSLGGFLCFLFAADSVQIWW